MTTMVTGAGMVGSRVAAHLLEAGESNPVLYDVTFSTANLAEVVDLARVTLVRGDVTEPTELLSAAMEHGVTRIIHTAGLLTSAVNERFAAGVRINLMGTLAVLEIGRLLHLERVVFCSSGSAIIGRPFEPGALVPAAVELDCIEHVPPGPYSTMKLAGEWLCRNYQAAFGLSTVSVRPAGVYAPWHGAPSGQPANLIRLAAQGAVDGVVRLSATDAATGMDFVHASDVAKVLALACAHDDPPSPVYYAANGVSYSMPEVVDVARTLVHHDVALEVSEGDSYMSYRPGPAFDIEPARRELGYEPAYPLEAGLREYIDWCRANWSEVAAR